MTNVTSSEALDQLFRTARTYNEWSETDVDERTVRNIYDLLKWGPTSANVCPARFVWVRSSEGKTKLAALAAERNQPKILAAPLTVIVGNDLDFADTLPKLLPHNAEAIQKVFAQPGVAEITAMRNGSLQGAYLIIAARALGLDCGPMSGFDNAVVDRAFFVARVFNRTSSAAWAMASPARHSRATQG
jgi:3-hydroxypropanoate dehydrogenase